MIDTTNIIYSLNIDDIQTVAIAEIDRELTEDEIEKIKDLISEKINWYDAILYTIIQNIDLIDLHHNRIKEKEH